MPSAKSDFISVAEVDHMELLLTLVILLRRVNLERFDHHVVLVRFLYLEYLMTFFSMCEVILELRFAKLTMENLPGVRSNMRSYLLVFIPAQPLSQALQVHILHRASAFAWRNQRIILFGLFRKANSARTVRTSQVIDDRIVSLYNRLFFNYHILVQFMKRTNTQTTGFWTWGTISTESI
jgi:hypothetical protein